MSTARFRVFGRVQGVAFRAHAREEARRLGLCGHARNLDDGSVEVVAQGNDASVDAFAGWLAQGPPSARVDALRREAIDDASPMRGFGIG